jgi:4-hydroxy-tetrahydrodipicolinate synthase
VVRDGPAATIDLFRGMASVTNLPLIVQNAPPPLGSGFGSDFVVRLLEAVPEITYLKEENTPGGQRISQVRAKAPATLKGIFGGAGGRYLMDELHRGAIGVMPACEITEIHVRIHDAFARGETALARSLYDRTLPLLTFQAVFRMNMTKEVLVRRGLIAHPHVRVGAVPLDARDQEELDALLHDLADLTIGLPR